MDDKTKQMLDAYCGYLEASAKNIRIEIEKDHLVCSGDQVADNLRAGAEVLLRLQGALDRETEAHERRN